MKDIVSKDRNELAQLFSGVGVEVGVAEGEFAETILQLGKVSKLYGVDPFKPLEGYRDYVFEKTFQRLYDTTMRTLMPYTNWMLIQETSMEAVKHFDDNSLDFVYIDADHSYEHVLQDITEWAKKVKPGGIVSGDDYVRRKGQDQYYNVVDAVDKYVADNNLDLTIYGNGRSNWMFIK